nr:unnamed protein product [Spirometra erinaceieuropaei]
MSIRSQLTEDRKPHLPQFRPITPESVRLAEERYRRQLRRDKKARMAKKEKQRTRRRRKEWLQNVIEKGEMNIDEEEEPEDGIRATSIALISTDAVSETLDQGRTQPGAKRVKTTKALEEDREIKEDEDEPELPEKPSLIFATGKKLIPPLSNRFCSRRYTGTPLEEMDDFYRNKRTCIYSLLHLRSLHQGDRLRPHH